MNAEEHLTETLNAVERRVGRALTSIEAAYVATLLMGYCELLHHGYAPEAVAAIAKAEMVSNVVH